MKGFYVSAYEHLKEQMLAGPKVWLVTGVAGFIGFPPESGAGAGIGWSRPVEEFPAN
jgi:hypothetical protein